MGKINRPRHGSMAFRPRKRANSQVPGVGAWPAVEEPALLGFVGFKAGMTHIRMIDDDPGSVNKGHEISTAVTVLEAPPIHVFCVRAYEKTPYGKRIAFDLYEEKFDAKVAKELTLTKNPALSREKAEKKKEGIVDVRVLAYTKPGMCGFGKKNAEAMEIGLGGKDAKAKLDYAKTILGKDIKASDFVKDGEYIDTIAVTKGHGWQGPVKRFGISMQRHKATNKYRHVGTLGPWHPSRVMYTVPMAGQTGYHNRTESGKRVLKVADVKDAVTPKGGFMNYGVVKNDYVMVKGSVAGPAKRLIRMRKSVRPTLAAAKPDIRYLSLESKQGV